MRSGRLLPAWAGVHLARPAVVLLAVTCVTSTLLGGSGVSQIAAFRFTEPISFLLLLPALAGTLAAIGCHNAVGTDLALPDPPRARVLRALWASVWAGASVAAVLPGLVLGAIGWLPVVRNSLLHFALALVVVAFAHPMMAWSLPFGYTLTSMFFGFPVHAEGFFWWAVVLERTTTPLQWVVVLSCVVGALGVYTGRSQGARAG